MAGVRETGKESSSLSPWGPWWTPSLGTSPPYTLSYLGQKVLPNSISSLIGLLPNPELGTTG